MNTKNIIGIIVAVALVVGIVFVVKKNNVSTTPVDTNVESSYTTNDVNTNNTGATIDTGITVKTDTKTTSNTTNTGPKTYTIADVAVHNSKTDCWSAINGSVYNLTPWVGKHPGGQQAIAGICGKDGSDAFNGKHGGQARPTTELAGFKIGTLN